MLIDAINKYQSHKWDDKTLAEWACGYLWILEGGCSLEVQENLTPLQHLLKETITYNIDSLAFFNDLTLDNEFELNEWILEFKYLDKVYKTSDKWHAYCAQISIFDEYNTEYYILLENEEDKEYIIIHSDYFLEVEYIDKFFIFLNKEDFIEKIKLLKSNNYSYLPYLNKYFEEDLIKEMEGI